MSDHAIWTDEWSRIYLQLMVEQKRLGNWNGNNLSSIGKQKVKEQFNNRTGNNWSWKKFKNRYIWFRKQFELYKELTFWDESQLIFESESGRLAMSDAWWATKLKEYPTAAMKLRKKPLRDVLLLEEVFRGTTVAGCKGWGVVAAVEPKGSDLYPLEADSGASNENDLSVDQCTNSCNSGKRTKPVDHSSSDTRPAKKSIKNNIKSTVENSVVKDPYGIASSIEVLCDLEEELKLGCRLWWAAVYLFEQSAEKRETFIAIPSQELRVQWLENTLGVSRYDQ